MKKVENRERRGGGGRHELIFSYLNNDHKLGDEATNRYNYYYLMISHWIPVMLHKNQGVGRC
jgi:hypothetical protein